jgi:(S)-2-hydroxyglutarate dehydrogenase
MSIFRIIFALQNRNSMNQVFDVAIIGGGIVGIATAYQLAEMYPKRKIVIIEKENELAQHQTGHNSGVIHSGLYYKPGSLKALNCIRGYRMLLEFAREHNIPHEICGKVVVATLEEELPRLENLYQRGHANGLNQIKKIGPEEIKEYEPHCAGLAALWVPYTGIIDYVQMAIKMAELLRERHEAALQYETKVENIKRKGDLFEISSSKGTIRARRVISCAGLYSDKVAEMTENKVDVRIVPFRGEYYKLKPEKEYLVKNLIYPVPDPNFPFLGVHFTRMIHGGIEAGPNAVLAYAREGYTKSDINLKEFAETLAWPGFRKVAFKYWKTGLGELYRSYSKAAFTKALQRLIPELKQEDIFAADAGVRAQACHRTDGLLDDFMIIENEGIMHVCNAPSPAATSSLSIGYTLAEKLKI